MLKYTTDNVKNFLFYAHSKTKINKQAKLSLILFRLIRDSPKQVKFDHSCNRKIHIIIRTSVRSALIETNARNISVGQQSALKP